MIFKQIFGKESLSGLRFVIPPFCALILGKVLFELLAFGFPELNQTVVENISDYDQKSVSEVSYSELKSRLLWITSVAVYFFVCIGFAAFIWQTMARIVSGTTLLLYIGIVLFSVILEILYLLLIADSSTSPLLAIFGFTFNSLTNSGVYSASQLLIIKNVMDIVNLIALIVAPLGIVTGGCIMMKNSNVSDLQLSHLRDQSRHMKELLTGGSAVMVIGIIHMKLWLHWPIYFIGNPKLHEDLELITSTVCQYWGVAYTLTMVALYLPSALYLSEQARIVIMASDDEETRKNPAKWLDENKMQPSATAQLPQLVAAIAPMLVGSFGSNWSNIFQI